MKKMILVSVLICMGFIVACDSSLETISKHFELLPVMYDPTEVGLIGPADKKILLEKGRVSKGNLHGLELVLDKVSEEAIIIKCNRQGLSQTTSIYAIHTSKREAIIAVQYNYAQVNEILIFKISKKTGSYEIIGSTANKLGVLPKLSVNDFLMADKHVDNPEDIPVNFYINEAGLVCAEPFVWMMASFETIEFDYKIDLEWIDGKFIAKRELVD